MNNLFVQGLIDPLRRDKIATGQMLRNVKVFELASDSRGAKKLTKANVLKGGDHAND